MQIKISHYLPEKNNLFFLSKIFQKANSRFFYYKFYFIYIPTFY